MRKSLLFITTIILLCSISSVASNTTDEDIITDNDEQPVNIPHMLDNRNIGYPSNTTN